MRAVWGGDDLQGFDFPVLIAVRVVRQALSDLEVHEVTDIQTQQELQLILDDAYDFLTRRLWDSECLWLDLLGHCLVKQTVLQEVAVRWERTTA